MGKNNIISKGLWTQYSQKVQDRMNNPRYKGSFDESEATEKGLQLIMAENGAASCGDSMMLYLLVDPKTDIIVDGRFQSFGCGTAIAAGDATTELCIGKTMTEARAITNLEVEAFLRDEPDTPAVPPQKMHCSVMAYEVIRDAVQSYTGMEDTDDEDIVCECARVRLRTIQEAIKNHNLKTVKEITHHTKAGGYCKSCIQPGGHEDRKYYLSDILSDTRKFIDTKEQNPLLQRLEQSHKLIEK